MLCVYAYVDVLTFSYDPYDPPTVLLSDFRHVIAITVVECLLCQYNTIHHPGHAPQSGGSVSVYLPGPALQNGSSVSVYPPDHAARSHVRSDR